MMDNGVGHIAAMASVQLQPEPEIHVFGITEVPRVETSRLLPGISTVRRCRRARRENRPGNQRPRHSVEWLAMSVPPDQTSDMEHIPRTIDKSGLSIHHQS